MSKGEHSWQTRIVQNARKHHANARANAVAISNSTRARKADAFLALCFLEMEICYVIMRGLRILVWGRIKKGMQ